VIERVQVRAQRLQTFREIPRKHHVNHDVKRPKRVLLRLHHQQQKSTEIIHPLHVSRRRRRRRRSQHATQRRKRVARLREPRVFGKRSRQIHLNLRVSRRRRRRVVAQLRRPQVLFVRRVARALRRLRAAPREPKPRSRLSSDAVRARERADELAARARVAAVRDECAPAPLEARVGFAERGRDLARGLAREAETPRVVVGVVGRRAVGAHRARGSRDGDLGERNRADSSSSSKRDANGNANTRRG
tara:strand:- start:13905 stop:14642 length:738 start_codon:yes stop_codon:yes gene_type:complete